MTLPAERTQGGIELLAQLEQAGAVTMTGLQLPPSLSWDQYAALATMLGQLHRTSAWLIGDLLNFGEKVYGETYTQVVSYTGLTEQTCYNYASICKYVPQPRRRAQLPFSVHAAVAYKEPEEQEYWLNQAIENGWKRADLRAAMHNGLIQDPGSELEVLPPAVGLTVCPHCGGSLDGYTPATAST